MLFMYIMTMSFLKSFLFVPVPKGPSPPIILTTDLGFYYVFYCSLINYLHYRGTII